jgi:proline iminopeptidase
MLAIERWAPVEVTILVAVVSLTGCGGGDVAEQQERLWPEIEPFESDHLRVSELHEIYYELCGNPEGQPVFVLHGGPGGNSSPYSRRFFDPRRYLIVQHDQRGAGQSRPRGELLENDTWELVEDIGRLRRHLELDKVILFGGSWGTTLALAHAERYPEHVSALVLRGVFTARQSEIDHFYHDGVADYFPETHAQLLAELPDPQRRPLPAYLYELIATSEPQARDRYSRAWTRYEFKISELNLSDEVVEGFLDKYDYSVFALFENYYMAQRCFLEEGQLLRDAHRLAGIPTWIVNGRYDVICPPRTAYELHQRIPGSQLILVEAAGHWMGEPAIEQALVEIFRELGGGT